MSVIPFNLTMSVILPPSPLQRPSSCPLHLDNVRHLAPFTLAMSVIAFTLEMSVILYPLQWKCRSSYSLDPDKVWRPLHPVSVIAFTLTMSVIAFTSEMSVILYPSPWKCRSSYSLDPDKVWSPLHPDNVHGCIAFTLFHPPPRSRRVAFHGRTARLSRWCEPSARPVPWSPVACLYLPTQHRQNRHWNSRHPEPQHPLQKRRNNVSVTTSGLKVCRNDPFFSTPHFYYLYSIFYD